MDFRVTNEKGWEYRFTAHGPESLRRGVRKGWDEWIRRHCPSCSTTHPSFAYKKHRQEIDNWLSSRMSRPSATEDQKKSWQAAADHRRYKLDSHFGRVSSPLKLHVRSEVGNGYLTTASPHTAGVEAVRVHRNLDHETSRKLIDNSRAWVEHDRNLTSFAAGVGNDIRTAIKPAKPVLRVIRGGRKESVNINTTYQDLLEVALTRDQLYAVARKAKESEHAGEREAMTSFLKKHGHTPDSVLSGGAPRSQRSSPHPATGPMRSGGNHPEWAWAGESHRPSNSTIYRNDYSDVNYIKKRLWELGGKSTKEEHTVHQFDGNFFRHTFTTYGNKGLHKEMAKAMLKWGSSGNPYKTKAVFVSTNKDPKRLHLIWANGQHVPTGKYSTTHKSFNRNPGNDTNFTRNLSSWIDQRVPSV